MVAFVAVCVTIQAVSLFMSRPVQKDIVQTFWLWTWIQYFLAGGGYALLNFRIIQQDLSKAARGDYSRMDDTRRGILDVLRDEYPAQYPSCILL